MRADLTAIGDAVIASVKGYVSKAVTGLSLRLDDFDARLKATPAGQRGEKGDPGDAGKDAEPVDVARIVADVVALIPKPERGERGDPGKDADPSDTEEFIATQVQQAIDAIPKPKDGANGQDADAVAITNEVLGQVTKALEEIPAPKDGKDGRDGADGESVSAEQIEAIVQRNVAAVVAKIELPKDGANGKDADPEVIRTEVARAVDAIPKPRDGQDADPRLVEVLVRSAVESIPKPTNGKDGRDGKDGFGFDDMTMEYDGARSFAVKFTQGERVKAFAFQVPFPLDRGVYKSDTAYTLGDVTTWDGSAWIAQRETQDKPGASDAWRLAVKHGRDGKDGLRGEKGERGSEGRAGHDLTQLGFDGRKT